MSGLGRGVSTASPTGFRVFAVQAGKCAVALRLMMRVGHARSGCWSTTSAWRWCRAVRAATGRTAAAFIRQAHR